MVRKSTSAYVRSRNTCVILDSIPNCGKGRNRTYQGHLSQSILVASLSAVVAVCTTVPVWQMSPHSETGSPCIMLRIDLISSSALIADVVQAGEELGMRRRRRCPGERAGLEPLPAEPARVPGSSLHPVSGWLPQASQTDAPWSCYHQPGWG